MSFLSRIFNRPAKSDSAEVAKQRLQLVLAQDRTNISPDTLNVLKDEMIIVISKYVEIDRANVQVSMAHTNRGEQLIANIPVVGARAPAPPATVPRRTPTRRTRGARA
ncbi:MAG: cell division topological specificity factor MinE [Chloroflexota bacterium]